VTSERSVRGYLWLAIIAVGAGLILMAFLGFYNRYWSDDWCYERDLDQLGVLGTLSGYFFTGDDAVRGYSTNRYSLTLITALLHLLGMPGTQLVASLLVTGLTCGIFAASGPLFHGMPEARYVRVLLSLAVAFFTLAASTARFQVLYWRAGIHYTTTIIVGLFMLAIILRYGRVSAPPWIAYTGLTILGLFGGGLSETGCVYLTGAFATVALVAGWARRHRPGSEGKTLELAAVAAGALLIAMLALILSPSNDRYRVHVDYPIAPFMVPFAALEFAGAFIRSSLLGLPLPHAAVLASSFFFAILATRLHPAPSWAPIQTIVMRLMWAAFLAFFLITLIQIPAAYFYGAPLDARGQSLSRFTMLALLAVVGWSVGRGIAPRGPTWLLNLSILATLAFSAYSVRFSVTIFGELDGFVHRAALWDARDAHIRMAVASGQTHIEVPVIDTHQIGTRDLIRSIVMDEWAANCATEYYGAAAFRAIPP